MNTSLCQEDEFAHTFVSAVDRPIGRVDCIPSGITGKALRYFTPDPLPELLERGRLIEPVPRTERDPLIALLLVRAAARNKSSGTVDFPQARRLLRILQGAASFSGTDDLVRLGMEVNPNITGLRQQISFVGGIVPSSARHIYAPHTTLPALMSSLVDGLNGEGIRRCDPLIAPVIVGAFCACMHPFEDGNGRWSRLVAASISRAQSIWPVMTGVVFQHASRNQLGSRALPEVGLRQYLEAALQFEIALSTELSSGTVLQCAARLTDTLRVGAKSQAATYAVLGRLYASGSVPIADIKKGLGLSQRAAEGLARKAVDQVEGMVAVKEGYLDGRRLMGIVDSCIERSTKLVLG